MTNCLRAVWLITVLLFLSGCVSTSLTADVDPEVDLSSLQTFYVAKYSGDKRGTGEKIVEGLQAMGKEASFGVDQQPEEPVDVVVQYRDKWMWDITMYMLELNIELRDGQTNYKFASGQSNRTSLARRSAQEMIREVLDKIFGVETAAGEDQ